VDDDPEVRETLTDYLRAQGHDVLDAPSGEIALGLVEREVPDLVLTDVHMGGLSGIELTRRLKADPRLALIPVVILTAVADLPARLAGLEAGADDFFAKPVEFVELRARVAALLRAKALVDELERAESIITTLARTIEARDPYTAGHCERLGRYATAVGQALGVDEATLKALRLGGYLHDLGKIAISDGILLKPGRLDAEERLRIHAHPAVGADLLRPLRSLDGVRAVVRHHHERWDGSGYPDGLQGEAIPLAARIMAVVDVYDALHTARPYKPALGQAEAVAILRRETERGAWDPDVVVTFLAVLRDQGRP